jgi:hypothetical protein
MIHLIFGYKNEKKKFKFEEEIVEKINTNNNKNEKVVETILNGI